MQYSVHPDGSFDILGNSIQLREIYPAINGSSIHAMDVELTEESVTYHLMDAAMVLNFSQEDGRLAISCELTGLPGIHDVEVLGGASLQGGRQVFVQGLGMEGPSGIYPVNGEVPVSHGICALCGDDGCLVCYAVDHTRFSTAFRIRRNAAVFTEYDSFHAGFNLEGAAVGHELLPTLYLEEEAELADGLHKCAERIARHMDARQCMPPAFHWCSWYYWYQNFDQKTLGEYVEHFREYKELPFRYIQVDAGYCPSIGDWLLPNGLYPGGLEKAAQTIRSAGFEAGIWIAPFIVGDHSELYRKHPDWILRDRDGEPLAELQCYTELKIWGNPDNSYYILDASHPEALAYLRTVFETLRSWGFTFFKTDFMLWNMKDSSLVKRKDPTKTSVEILRNLLSVIREAVGEDSYILGSIAPFMPFIGFADGMRIAGDVGAQWADTYGPVNLIRELPADSYFQNVFWQNDPDAVLLRNFDTFLTEEETRSLALLQAVSGGVITTSDPVHEIGENRRRLLELIRPAGKVRPELPFLKERDREELVLLHRLEQGTLLYILNPTEHSLNVAYHLGDWLGGNSCYQYQYNWDEEHMEGIVESDVYINRLMPHESALVFITKEPLSTKPANLWNW